MQGRMTFMQQFKKRFKQEFLQGFPQTNADIIHSLAQGGVTKTAASTVLLRRRGERKGKEGD